MCALTFAGFVPHPPLLIEGIGDEDKGEVIGTDQAYRELARRLIEKGPKRVVIISPHGPVFSDAYTMPGWDTLEGDFTPFGSPVSMQWPADREYAERAEALAMEQDFPLVTITSRQLANHRHGTGLDHGTMLPLWYLQRAGWEGKVVCVRIGGLPPAQCYAIGRVLAQATEGEDTAIIASGDLSHCLTEDGPSPYNPAGVEFDNIIVEALSQGDFQRIIAIPPDFRQRAAECGWRPLVTLLGCFDGRACRSEVLSYEGPFGVGYLVAAFEPQAPGTAPGLSLPETRQKDKSPLVILARNAIRYFLETDKYLDPPSLEPPFANKAGAFVSLKLDDQLRGCIGTIEAEQDNLAQEIVTNAVSAASEDPRFEPVTLDELDQLSISVDVLGEPKPAEYRDLDPAKLGLIAQWQGRRGLLLPDLPGVDTPQEQLEIVCQKAGIPLDKAGEAALYTFTVERHN